MLLRFAGKFISPFFAEDIVHDVFLKIWDKQVFLLSESEVKNLSLIHIWRMGDGRIQWYGRRL